MFSNFKVCSYEVAGKSQYVSKRRASPRVLSWAPARPGPLYTVSRAGRHCRPPGRRRPGSRLSRSCGRRRAACAPRTARAATETAHRACSSRTPPTRPSTSTLACVHYKKKRTQYRTLRHIYSETNYRALRRTYSEAIGTGHRDYSSKTLRICLLMLMLACVKTWLAPTSIEALKLDTHLNMISFKCKHAQAYILVGAVDPQCTSRQE